MNVLKPNTNRSSRRGLGWVSKTDITRYLDCPYSFWLIDSGEVDQNETLTIERRIAIERGNDFERSIAEATAPPPKGLAFADLARSHRRIYDLPHLENRSLEIHGVPDGVDTSGGAMLPIEIKARPFSKYSDALELAFYWQLLGPHRTTPEESPKGILILKSRDSIQETLVELSPTHFAEVGGLIDAVRVARSNGVRPGICDCPVCATRPEVQQRSQLTKIYNVSRERAIALCEIGIASLDSLLSGDPTELARQLRAQGIKVGIREILRWQQHAKSQLSGKPIRVGDGHFRRPDVFVALDTEYEPGREFWLLGICICTPLPSKPIQFWADNRAQLQKAIERAWTILRMELLQKHPKARVITWSGSNADLPCLERSTALCDGPPLDILVKLRHLDLFQFVRRNFRFPTPGLGLKDVAAQLGVGRASQVSDGRAAQGVYMEYLSSRGEARKHLKKQLLEYNSDDLRLLVEVAGRISQMDADY